MLWSGALLALLVGLLLSGRRSAARVEREYLARRPLGPDGVHPGARPLHLSRAGGCAVLLIHGGGDTPQTLRYLADHLHACGYAVRAPLLPGHGRSLRDFTRVTAALWLDEVRREYAALRERFAWVAVVGLSMGGALTVRLAAERRDIPALGLIAPYLAMPPRVRRAAALSRLWGAFVTYVSSRDGQSIHDPAEQARNLAYGYFTPAALRALAATVRAAWKALPHVAAPTLVIHSREDNRIAPADAERNYARLGAAEKRLVWLDRTGHVITVDYGREQVFAQVAAWLAAHRPPAGDAGASPAPNATDRQGVS